MMGMKKPSKIRHHCKVEINLSSLIDVNDLIVDLREARRKAKRTGGSYHVGRENFDGERVIFNIGFPTGECI